MQGRQNMLRIWLQLSSHCCVRIFCRISVEGLVARDSTRLGRGSALVPDRGACSCGNPMGSSFESEVLEILGSQPVRISWRSRLTE